MDLDIATPRGQVSLKDEQIVASWFSSKKNHVYAQTPKDSPVKIDALLIKDGNLVGLAETKCRYNIDLAGFKTRYKNEWLITAEKVESSLKLAEQFCVPLYGLLYLVNDDVLLIQNLSKARMYKKFTKTQKTINGGKIVRENSFVSMENALIRYSISKLPHPRQNPETK